MGLDATLERCLAELSALVGSGALCIGDALIIRRELQRGTVRPSFVLEQCAYLRELQAKLERILGACAEGELSPDEAEALIRVSAEEGSTV